IMRKITRPGQAAIAAAAAKDDVIDVEGAETSTSAFPRAAGGLRKLFQIPASTNGDTDDRTPNGRNGAPKPAAGAKSAGTSSKATPAKGASGGTAKSGAAGSRSSGSGARRRNNKKRKRR